MTAGITRYRIGDNVYDPSFLPHQIEGVVTAVAHGMVRVHWRLSDQYEWVPSTDIRKA
jgi:hypothetical protein